MPDSTLLPPALDDVSHEPACTTSGAVGPAKERNSFVEYVAIALLAYVPMLASRPGLVSDDTKLYLYFDPGRLLRGAVSMWNPDVQLGTVTHQNIGYLLPMGPFYWLLAELHVPVWVAQRLWMGSILFGAGAGVLYLCRTFGLRGPGRFVAAFGFMFSPYILQYAGRISVILLAWAGLPWMVAFVIHALRRGGWKYPALFALVVALVGGINATSVLYVGIAPALWLPFAVLVLREATWRQAWGVAWRVGLLSILVSLWWVAGLEVEAAYGLNVLKYTENVQSTSGTSAPMEVLRGLGYWYFYGAGNGYTYTQPLWTQAAFAYTQDIGLVLCTFLFSTMAFAAAALTRWRLRSYFVLLLVVGVILAVGPFPYATPTLLGGWLKAFMSDTTAGLALRSTDRATPLVILALAVLLGAGVTALGRRAHRTGWVVAALAALVVVGAAVPLWTGAIVVNGDTEPASPPRYVQEAVAHLDATHPGTRVYGLPGNAFAAYTYGNTVDPIFPALLSRPFVTDEQFGQGSLPTYDLLTATNSPWQDGVPDMRTLAPMAALMSAGDVLVQYDQAYGEYDAPNPRVVAHDLTPTPRGLSDPVSYGTPRPNVSAIPHLDEQVLSLPPHQPWTSPLVSYTVKDPRPIVRAESLRSPMIVDGNGAGLVSASSVGLLGGNPTIFYAGTLDTDPHLRAEVQHGPADLVVTDTNRKQGYRWTNINGDGYTETAPQGPDLIDSFDNPLNLFTSAPTDAQTTTVFHGLTTVTASSYGSPVHYYNDERPAAALDGNVHTAWVVAEIPFEQWWQVGFSTPKTADSINLVQPLTPHPADILKNVAITFDGVHPVYVQLNQHSLTPAGQTVTFPRRTFSTLRITIQKTDILNHHVGPYGKTVGFAEVRIPGVTADESVSMPQDLLRSVGATSKADPLTLVMTRLRASGFPPRGDTEATLRRLLWLPTARTFSAIGQARIAPQAAQSTVNRLTGRPGAAAGGLDADSSSRLAGDVAAGAMSAVDANPDTAWQTGLGVSPVGSWASYRLPAPISFHTLDLQVVADRQHSVPTALTVTAGNVSEHVDLPPIKDGHQLWSIARVPVNLPTTLTGSTVRITVDGARTKQTPNYYSGQVQVLPIAVAEWGIPGLSAPPLPAALPPTCRDDLLTVDGTPVWVTVQGTTAAALDRDALALSLCGPDAAGLSLGAGNHFIASAPGPSAGFDVDQLALSSRPGGGPAAVGAGGVFVGSDTRGPSKGSATTASTAPSLRVEHQTATSLSLAVSGVSKASAPFLVVLGESLNAGWRATVAGHDLGAPVLVDGYANAWRVDPATLGTALNGGQLTVDVRWTPQRRVDIALLISAVSLVGCLLLAIIPGRRRRRRGAPPTDEAPSSVGAVATAADPLGDFEPELFPLMPSVASRTRSIDAVMAISLATAVVAGIVESLVVGVMVGLATAVALHEPRARRLLGVLSLGSMVAGTAYVVIRQAVEHIPYGGGWPAGFPVANGLAWAAVLFLAADVVVEFALRPARTARAAAPVPSAPAPAPAAVSQPDR